MIQICDNNGKLSTFLRPIISTTLIIVHRFHLSILNWQEINVRMMTMVSMISFSWFPIIFITDPVMGYGYSFWVIIYKEIFFSVFPLLCFYPFRVLFHFTPLRWSWTCKIPPIFTIRFRLLSHIVLSSSSFWQCLPLLVCLYVYMDCVVVFPLSYIKIYDYSVIYCRCCCSLMIVFMKHF